MYRLYRVKDVAEAAGLHPNVVWRMVWDGTIPHHKLGEGVRSSVRIEGPDAARFLESRGRGYAARSFNQTFPNQDYYTYDELTDFLVMKDRKTASILLKDISVQIRRRGDWGPAFIGAVKRETLERWLRENKRLGKARNETRTHH